MSVYYLGRLYASVIKNVYFLKISKYGIFRFRLLHPFTSTIRVRISVIFRNLETMLVTLLQARTVLKMTKNTHSIFGGSFKSICMIHFYLFIQRH